MHIDLRAIADAIGYPAAGLGILIESAGIPFPGETMLLLVAAYAASGSLEIRLVIPFGAMGAIMGADLGYAVGYFGGRPFVERLSRFLRLSARPLARAELFFAHHGAPTIFVARFIPGLRSWASMMAGMARMPFWTFQAYTAIGGIAWAIVIGSIGYYLGSNWGLIARVAGYLGLGGLAVAATLAVVMFLMWRRTARS